MGLSKTKFQGVDLQEADLSLSNLFRADLTGANLIRADLHGASLVAAILTGAELGSVNLHNASLYQADLSQADLREAEIKPAGVVKALRFALDSRDSLGPHRLRLLQLPPEVLGLFVKQLPRDCPKGIDITAVQEVIPC